MENSTKVLDCIIIAINIISWIFFPALVSLIIIISIFSVLYGLVYIIGDKTKITKQITTWVYKLSFPYTTDEVIILNAMKVVNFFIAKRFQFLHHFKLLKNKKKKRVAGKNIFVDNFNTFDNDTWRKDFPWGNANHVADNVYILNGKLITEMKKENFVGQWGGKDWNFINTSGMIYSKNTYPAQATYSAKVKFSNVGHINQSWWLLRIKDDVIPNIIEEIDFEYNLTEGKMTVSQHFGDCYANDNHFPDKAHRQDSFSFKINLSNGWHILKFKITKRNIFWYIDGVLVKWHFVGVPKLEQHIIFGMGNGGVSKDITDTGKLDLNKLPTKFKCDWIRVDKN